MVGVVRIVAGLGSAPRNLIASAHFWVSSAISVPLSAGACAKEILSLGTDPVS